MQYFLPQPIFLVVMKLFNNRNWELKDVIAFNIKV